MTYVLCARVNPWYYSLCTVYNFTPRTVVFPPIYPEGTKLRLGKYSNLSKITSVSSRPGIQLRIVVDPGLHPRTLVRPTMDQTDW